MKYDNPIIPGFHPDPSICRVGEDYYLVTSSFEYFPGVPIFHSRDLVHWRQIGHCLTRPGQLPLEKAPCSGGIYAPALRHHDGVFYMVTTNVSGYSNFFVTAKDPAGPWSDPVRLDHPGIDPDLFFDDDGTTYLTGGGIMQSRIDIRTGKRLGETRRIWPGTGGAWVEGPHLYKINGRYYLMVAEGGTDYGHMETIARSDSPSGPWEHCPHNPLLRQRDRGEHPVQCTGHADLVQAADGNWWMVFLGVRPSRYRFHHLGRETFLAPVTWTRDDWPIVNAGSGRPGGFVELNMEGPLPAAHPWPVASVRDDFDSPSLGFCWNFLRNPRPNSWSLDARKGFLRLAGSAATLDDVDSPAFIGRRQEHFNVRAAARLEFAPGRDGEEAGLTILSANDHHYDVAVAREDGRRTVFVRRRIGDLQAVTARNPLGEGPVVLEVRAEPLKYTIGYRPAGGEWTPLATASTRYVSTEVAGGFTGVYFGLYATGRGAPATAPADFDWFDYEP
jgi:xylan 1,4-beta-xylosidase